MLADAVGIGFAAVGEEHLFTFLLSSPFTARNIVREKGDIEEVRKDLEISLILSIMFSFLLAFLLKSKWTAIFGTVFGVVLYSIYKQRGKL